MSAQLQVHDNTVNRWVTLPAYTVYCIYHVSRPYGSTGTHWHCSMATVAPLVYASNVKMRLQRDV